MQCPMDQYKKRLKKIWVEPFLLQLWLEYEWEKIWWIKHEIMMNPFFKGDDSEISTFFQLYFRFSCENSVRHFLAIENRLCLCQPKSLFIWGIHWMRSLTHEIGFKARTLLTVERVPDEGRIYSSSILSSSNQSLHQSLHQSTPWSNAKIYVAIIHPE